MLKILLGWLQNGLGTDLGMDVHTNGHASPSLQCGELEWNFLDRFCYIYPSTRALGDISLVLENQQFTTNPNSQHVQIRKDRRIAGLATKQRITHKHFSYPFSSLCACSPSWPASLPSRRCSLLLWPTAPTPLPMWQLLVLGCLHRGIHRSSGRRLLRLHVPLCVRLLRLPLCRLLPLRLDDWIVILT